MWIKNAKQNDEIYIVLHNEQKVIFFLLNAQSNRTTLLWALSLRYLYAFSLLFTEYFFFYLNTWFSSVRYVLNILVGAAHVFFYWQNVCIATNDLKKRRAWEYVTKCLNILTLVWNMSDISRDDSSYVDFYENICKICITDIVNMCTKVYVIVHICKNVQ